MKFNQFPFIKPSPGSKPAGVDAASIQRTIEQALDSAGLGTTSGPMKDVMDLIHRSLEAAGLSSGAAAPRPTAGHDTSVIDVVAREVDTPASHVPAARRPASARGRLVSGQHTGAAGTRAYQVYLPAQAPSTPMPLVVMLHGCTQSPEDFAAGTRMNGLAERDGFIVVYPAQSANANGSKCWNWFRAQDQSREGGEPALIAGIVRDVAAQHSVDASRIFVAGLSAGAAMAVILGETYPELFAGIGVHSGLAYGAAHDMPSAFSAMGTEPRGAGRSASTAVFVPTIVFHGDRDHTVHTGNGAEVVAQALARERRSHPNSALVESMEALTSSGGQRCTRTVHRDASGRPQVEQWVLHGAGHAWSGGSSEGSYTDPTGADASEEMLKFFMSQGRGQSPG